VHTAISEDGYELILHHIPHGKIPSTPKGPVLLQHGLTDASAGFCLNSPQESLAYILADNGYDVWLGNNRGNGYSMYNTKFGPDDPRFWDFSWDEMALIDFPTLINYVVTTTNSPKISYIGHSEGTIQAFAGLVAKPEIASKLRIFVALAPVAYVADITVELLRVLARLDADELLTLLGLREFYLPDIAHRLLPDICRISPRNCNYGGDLFYGRDTYLNESRLEVYTNYEPFPTSSKNIIHWAQGVRSRTFRRYDYGAAGNTLHYGQSTPPPYELSKYPTTLPLVLVTGGIDGLADPNDVKILLSQLPSTLQPTIIHRDDYGHLDPLLGDASYRLTYPDVLQQLAKYT